MPSSGCDPVSNGFLDCTQPESTNAANRISPTGTRDAFAVRDRLSGIASSLARNLPADNCGLRIHTRIFSRPGLARIDASQGTNWLPRSGLLAGAFVLLESGFAG